MQDDGLLKKIKQFDEGLNYQAKFLRNYMKMFEVLLLFKRASRKENWELHLASLELMIPNFSSHDQLNNARFTPLYIAAMMELKENHEVSWKYLKDNFSINKTGTSFCSIGSDHAFEQDNKLLKVNRGVVGLTQNPTALHRFCLISPSLASLCSQFLKNSGIIDKSTKLKHYQLVGSINKRISVNVSKVINMLNDLSVHFAPSECVFNILSKAVLSSKASADILDHVEIGKNMYEQFVENRIKGSTPLWEKMKQRNLKTFQAQ